jgi:hypothetical protein
MTTPTSATTRPRRLARRRRRGVHRARRARRGRAASSRRAREDAVRRSGPPGVLRPVGATQTVAGSRTAWSGLAGRVSRTGLPTGDSLQSRRGDTPRLHRRRRNRRSAERPCRCRRLGCSPRLHNESAVDSEQNAQRSALWLSPPALGPKCTALTGPGHRDYRRDYCVASVRARDRTTGEDRRVGAHPGTANASWPAMPSAGRLFASVPAVDVGAWVPPRAIGGCPNRPRNA